MENIYSITNVIDFTLKEQNCIHSIDLKFQFNEVEIKLNNIPSNMTIDELLNVILQIVSKNIKGEIEIDVQKFLKGEE